MSYPQLSHCLRGVNLHKGSSFVEPLNIPREGLYECLLFQIGKCAFLERQHPFTTANNDHELYWQREGFITEMNDASEAIGALRAMTARGC